MDYDGMWNGNRKYAVRFRTRTGGIEYPPASFYIGGVKGYLYFYGQPKTCRRCGEEGHIAALCPNTFCRNCLEAGHLARDCKKPKSCNLNCFEAGHLARDCKKPKSCNLCDSTEHMFKDCPERHKTYGIERHCQEYSFVFFLKGIGLPGVLPSGVSPKEHRGHQKVQQGLEGRCFSMEHTQRALGRGGDNI
uniref:CCHC-type domain-containing protein n=1 Tax=Salmo trutta TaxID=8032 RepID=A0A673WJB3_SALTR